MSDLRTFDSIRESDLPTVGGKGLSLGLMAGASLPVPPGFCITTICHQRLRNQDLTTDPAFAASLADAYRALGQGPVAVRSSATAEDGATTSFAGQQETILGVEGIDNLLAAVKQCWDSLDSERARAYRLRQGVVETNPSMAVVVQKLVDAEVAGVLFTRDPLDTAGEKMLVEASWGLGESVVSGRVSPDRFHLDRTSGRVLDRHIASKTLQSTRQGYVPVPAEKQTLPCLSEEQFSRLADLGRKVEAFYGAPRDIEWAYAEGQFWLLQARPITAAGADEREGVRQEEIAALRARAETTGTVWGRFNLAEVLPEPTPMTWAIVRHSLMSGKGGYGLMFRDLGFDPDPALDEEGVFDLICGRPYCNLSHEARMHYRKIPFEYPFQVLKADPRQAFYPAPVINHARLPWHFWLLLPIQMPLLMFQLVKGNGLRVQQAKVFAEQYRSTLAPAFRKEVANALAEDFTSLESSVLLQRLTTWIKRTLVDFARDSLKPSALAQQSLKTVEVMLTPALKAERSRAAARELIMGVHPEEESDLAGAVQALVQGKLNEEEFLTRFGHRCGQEMELSRPRWSEAPEALRRQARHPGGAGPHESEASSVGERIATEAKLAGSTRTAFLDEVKTLQTYIGLRETAKNDLMRGHALLRRILLELDRRYRLQGGIFYLVPAELARLVAGEDLSALITARRKRRQLALSVEVPAVLFSDDLEAVGRPLAIVGAETLQGTPLSAGVAEAPALVLDEPPEGEAPGEGYILVCPTTDPAWVPLFIHARGLVMETGGVLSHGAIVAREFGLPAVAGLPDVQRRIRTGQRLRVDGASGTVTVLG